MSANIAYFVGYCIFSYIALRWYYRYFRFSLVASFFTVALFPLLFLAFLAIFNNHIVVNSETVTEAIWVFLGSFLGATISFRQLNQIEKHSGRQAREQSNADGTDN